MIDLDSIGLTEDRRSQDILQEGLDLSAPEAEENFHEMLSQNETGVMGAGAEADPTAQSMVPDERDTAEARTAADESLGAPVEESAEESEEERLRREEATRPNKGSTEPSRGAAKEHMAEGARVKDLNAHHPLVSSLMVHGAKGGAGRQALTARNTNQNLLDQWKSVKDPGQKAASAVATRPEGSVAAGHGGGRVAAGNKTGNPGSLELRQTASRTAGGEGGTDPTRGDKGNDAAGAMEKQTLQGTSARGRSSGQAQRREPGGDSGAFKEAPREVTPSSGNNAAPPPVEGQGGAVESTPTAGRAPNGGLEFGGLSTRSMTSTVASGHAAKSPGEATSGAQLADRVRLEEFSAGLERFVLKGTSKVQMRLDPPELGTVDIEIEVTDGEVFLSVRAESAEAVSALQSEMELLRESLKEQGLDLSHFELGHPDRDSGDSGKDPASSSAEGKGDRSRHGTDAEDASTTTRGITADGRLDVMV